jgi:hypothetical protein
MRLASLLLSLLWLPSLFLAACSQPLPCSGPEIPASALWLDASAWFAAHPGDTLKACVDGRCQDVTEADSKRPVQLLPPPNTEPSKTLSLVVTDASGLDARRDFTPVLHSFPGPCNNKYWKTPADLTADGRLQPG